jgi:hypothetical protein
LSIAEIDSVLDRVVSKRLAVCPYFKRVLFSRECSPDVVHLYNLCCLDREHCSSHGRRLKFKPCFAGVRVVWVCPKVVGFPLECV